MRRPTDEQVRAALRSLLAETRAVETQRRFHALILERLRAVDPELAVSPERVRRLAARSDFVRVDVRARDGPKEKVLSLCPVCGGSLRRLKNQTLFGGEVTLVLKCSQCEYWTSKSKRIPTRYIFRAR